MKRKSLDNVTVVIIAFSALKKALQEESSESPISKKRNLHKKVTQGIDEINLCKLFLLNLIYILYRISYNLLELNLVYDYLIIIFVFLLMN